MLVRVVCICEKPHLNHCWWIAMYWGCPQCFHLTRQNGFSITLKSIAILISSWPAFCLYSQAADVSRVGFSSSFLVRKNLNHFNLFGYLETVYCFGEEPFWRAGEANRLSFSKRGRWRSVFFQGNLSKYGIGGWGNLCCAVIPFRGGGVKILLLLLVALCCRNRLHHEIMPQYEP